MYEVWSPLHIVCIMSMVEKKKREKRKKKILRFRRIRLVYGVVHFVIFPSVPAPEDLRFCCCFSFFG